MVLVLGNKDRGAILLFEGHKGPVVPRCASSPSVLACKRAERKITRG